MKAKLQKRIDESVKRSISLDFIVLKNIIQTLILKLAI